MERRTFLKNISISTIGTFALANIPIKALSQNSPLAKAAAASSNENVLIFVQLHGGNDALNTLVPIDQYSKYIELRANIALPDSGPRAILNVDDTVLVADQVGLHPDMAAFQRLYKDGKAVIVQNVGYPDMNMSHFRGRDLVFMGLDGTSDSKPIPTTSGWMGRFLDHEYPFYPQNYPTAEMPDPIGLEFGSEMSIAFTRSKGIPMGFNIPDPEGFFNLVHGSGVDTDKFKIYTINGHANDELKFLWDFKDTTNSYAKRLQDVYNAGHNSSVEYPTTYPGVAPANFQNNPLSGQLKIIARLLSGGIKTRIFLCTIGGFDTHANQVDKNDHTLGGHAALLYHLSSAIEAFQNDLANLGQEDKVLTMTFTEFGRRVHSNDSYGTDHGTSTPVFIFGKALDGKIMGSNPNLSKLNSGGNMEFSTDYRSIYNGVVQDWFGASNQTMVDIGFDTNKYGKLNLFGTTSVDDLKLQNSPGNIKLYPNPASGQVTVSFFIRNQTDSIIEIFDLTGKKLLEKKMGNLTYGQYNIPLQINALKQGEYICFLTSNGSKASEKLVVY